jgi:hypothetical protein
MARFKLIRQRESDGSVDHVLEFFLVGPDGHLRYQYLASEVHSERIAADIRQVSRQGGLAANSEQNSGRARNATRQLLRLVAAQVLRSKLGKSAFGHCGAGIFRIFSLSIKVLVSRDRKLANCFHWPWPGSGIRLIARARL